MKKRNEEEGICSSCTGVEGNFDDCELTAEERAAIVKVADILA